MVYCLPLTVKFLSQIKYTQLEFDSDSDYESYIQQQLIPPAQKVIDGYCNHNFNNNSGTITLDGNGKGVLIIPPPYVPVINVSSVTVDGTDVTSDIKTYDTYLAYDGGTFTEDEQNVTITLNYGYSSVPDDIEYICAQLCANILAEIVRKKMLPDTVAQALNATAGSGAIFSSPRVFTRELKEMLNPYRISSFYVT